ncbi:putative RNA methyltransferase-domain-containing protein [Paraphoma chrysanthemicola]|nr:putative RNA methyltransferase-domain-containing protein [Paraphoma chrysanthemicola]
MAVDTDTIVVSTNIRSKKGGKDEKTTTQSKKRKASSVIIHKNNSDQGSDGPSKKRKGENDTKDEIDIDTSRPTAVFTPTAPRSWTVSLALPGSWLLNAKKPDHKTMLVGRIARACAVFCVDEIIVFDDDPLTIDPKIISPRYARGAKKKTKQQVLDSILEEDEPWQNPDQFLYHVLSFAECPPHLRMGLFPKHKNLEMSGVLPSMDMPHHLRSHEWCRYREGVVVGPAEPPFTSRGKSAGEEEMEYAYVDCGLPYSIRVPIPPSAPVEAGMRTTVRFDNPDPPSNWPNLNQADCEALGATACANSVPREEAGYYWGYTVRRAASLSAVFTESEHADGYDYTLGTSERGVPIQSILPGNSAPTHKQVLPAFKHLLLVFGGVAGIEPAVVNDPELVAKGLGKANAGELFDAWVNLVPGQGSRTIRTEEAVEFGLCAIKPWVDGMYEK